MNIGTATVFGLKECIIDQKEYPRGNDQCADEKHNSKLDDLVVLPGMAIVNGSSAKECVRAYGIVRVAVIVTLMTGGAQSLMQS